MRILKIGVGKTKKMKIKTRTFRCHVCKDRIIVTDKKKVECSGCNSGYVLKDGKFYRENWITRAYKT